MLNRPKKIIADFAAREKLAQAQSTTGIGKWFHEKASAVLGKVGGTTSRGRSYQRGGSRRVVAPKGRTKMVKTGANTDFDEPITFRGQ